MHFDPASISQADGYKLLIGCIVPRPIAFVSTRSPDGRPNLAPFSFFNGISSNPLSLLFCPSNKHDGSEKDTLRNLLAGGPGGAGAEFAVNVVSAAFARKMAVCAEPLEYGESEFDLSGLAAEPCRVIRTARVVDSPATFECRVERIIRLNVGQPGGGNIVVGRVVSIFMREGLVNDRFHVDPAQLDAIGRMGGLGYCTTRDRFEMPMGRAALEP
ncbi:MAG: flavin reductase family protein [Phycisphaerales bacterium]|nr:flavin reductase family protein [Phycisphaerales bacterium]